MLVKDIIASRANFKLLTAQEGISGIALAR
jgi:hypothetical protein